jgi:DNA polymerase III delta subunit
MRESHLEKPDAELLSNKVNGSYDLAMLEIDKIHQYGDRLDKADSVAFHELLDCGVIYQPTETNVFDFVDAVCNKNNRSFKLAQTLIDNKVSAINALGTLYNSMKTIMLIKCFSGGKITEVTGLDNRQIFFNKKYAGKFSVPEIVEDVQFLIDLIDDIKSGKIEDKYAYFYALVHIL